MNDKQHTIQAPVTVRGIGLHTGVEATMTFCPAPVGHGYKFQRVDLPGQPIVDADVDNVVDLSRGTTIEQNGARVNTVEHTLAALVGLQLDNVLIQLSGPEPPIMDGSSAEFIKALTSVGFEEQNALRNYYEIPESIRYVDNARGVEIAALPLTDYRLTVMVDYNSPVLGSQHATLDDIGKFSEEIASSRTFCFLHELEMLYKNNLIRGGDLSNAIVVVDRVVSDDELSDLAKMLGKPRVSVKKEGILNNVDLRHKNEPARHKLLDLVGDLALVGRPLKGQILAARPGHAANVAFAKKIKKKMLESRTNPVPMYDPNREPVMDINRIMQVLPHRYPFVMIDKVIHLDDQVVTAVKNVSINEPFFQGHFPGNPVMPGVLQIEGLAQTGGILVMNTVSDPENYWQYFLGIENARFRKKVLPGDTIVYHCQLLAPIKRGIAKMRGQAFVNGKVVCEAEMSAAIVRKDS
ncbi:bifunctional UDP-3-O-[3-hydroxymyristoyl] N-acetylglucosamine deacetylase/3-hydroxyacyl-ACP dehydratase [Hymenobacter siberiensis]|jgi:UDP-3-O-[3-hydroxymyristoyl] N-acetylglucosamine deacetylase/3-hydroxyacyl-[acyl-carrier-protein] dehydratase|uniref:bifunctional UDP-3-O-[3-hydroxymyristoyl] N-acetylglucosamine deacetylase/3-hydroxyacyl-ACP dehydratase n=1 Tax=Hymenobacter siberiensis TaxID=2848396 RepID=UPI001C1E500F|nr:bifunctional UDP-3-O-[3-hydroxymyristoyl] N-acetylglucosamine deacetylase/3-hydroxyacyl-ACP dehydratase [Hymenobacter siberiensis]MBU6121980.1 bifunctional UDP-3-O-[3-hydroxymyristoyl] N-acetylglucosamine deacetylase/3-hydroxyacyl-ACP dehydratase [Hymenobacter siberiensis]